MTFVRPPIRRRYRISPEVIFLLLGIVLLLAMLVWMFSMNKTMRPGIVPDSAIARNAENRDGSAEAAVPEKHHSTVLKGGVSRSIMPSNPDDSQASLEASLQELLERSSANGVQDGGVAKGSEIPAGTELLGVAVKGDTVTVNLSEEFASGGGSTSMIGRVQALKNTIHRVNKHYKLRVAINGKPANYIGGEGLEIN